MYFYDMVIAHGAEFTVEIDGHTARVIRHTPYGSCSPEFDRHLYGGQQYIEFNVRRDHGSQLDTAAIHRLAVTAAQLMLEADATFSPSGRARIA